MATAATKEDRTKADVESVCGCTAGTLAGRRLWAGADATRSHALETMMAQSQFNALHMRAHLVGNIIFISQRMAVVFCVCVLTCLRD